MSPQKAMLLEIANVLSSGSERTVEAWFTEDFRLHDPAFPDWPSGHEGARAVMEQTTSLGPTTQLQALDMLEEGDRVAVRWRLSANREGEVFEYAMMSLYRFENGRIAEDWGMFFRGLWP